jgi:hypothetical protein
MKTKQIFMYGLLAVTLALVFTGCPNDTDPATCSATGEESGVCKLDPSHTTTREIAINPDGHDWDDAEIITPATCIKAGEETAECKLCGVKDEHHPIPIDLVDGHDWNDSYTTTTAATVTTDGTEAITCNRNPAHTKDSRTQYATGTLGLAFTLVSGDTAYGVEKGTATADSVIHIPAYHSPDADSPYLPVTQISGTSSNASSTFGGISDDANTVITAVHIPASVTSIGDYAFQYCGNLATVTFAEGSQLASIGASAFRSAPLASINIPEGVTTIGGSAFNSCTNLASVNIPESVTSIGSYLFAGCSSLNGVTIPKGVTSIGLMAFNNCTSLASITIPATVTTVGGGAFNNWTASCTAYAELAVFEASI